jgi:LacI family transcriptional regulator
MKRPTQADVAREAGVSRATVSYVLNGLADGRVPISAETRERVSRAIAKLRYVPDASAQALRSGSTKTIGLIIPDLQNPHFWENADGVAQEARAAGYHVLLTSSNSSLVHGQDVFRDLSRRRIDGLILMGSFVDESAEARAILTQLLQRGVAIVEISGLAEVENELDRVASDYRAATRELMSHLLALGHRTIGLINGVALPDLARDRVDTYTDCLRAAGIEPDPELLVACGPAMEDGYRAATQLLRRRPRPTALVAINDILAMGALRAAGDQGLAVPGDLSLVGFDDTPLAKFMTPRLTTASKDAVNMGRQAVRLLLARLHDPARPRQRVEVQTKVILRESVGPVAHTAQH